MNYYSCLTMMAACFVLTSKGVSSHKISNQSLMLLVEHLSLFVFSSGGLQLILQFCPFQYVLVLRQ